MPSVTCLTAYAKWLGMDLCDSFFVPDFFVNDVLLVVMLVVVVCLPLPLLLLMETAVILLVLLYFVVTDIFVPAMRNVVLKAMGSYFCMSLFMFLLLLLL